MAGSVHVAALRALLDGPRGVLLPGVPNALAARVAEDIGFEALYLTGAGLTNTFLGLPDFGFMDLSQLVEHVHVIRGVTDLPMIVDADTGFGNAVNVAHAVRSLERAGASAIQLEDQRSPKKCGHSAGKEVIGTDEMVGKIKAAVDARRDGVLICARTDAIAVEGFNAGIERARAYVAAGADLTFVEAPTSVEELGRIRQLVGAPQILNMVVGGRTPVIDREQAAALGFELVLYANAALQSAVLGMQTALGALRDRGRLDEEGGLLATFAERQRLVRKDAFDAMDKRYGTPAAPERNA